MRHIDPATVRSGVRLPLGLFTRQGVKLLAAGTVLTEEMCRMITRSAWGDLYLASSAADLQEASVLRVVDQAPAGGRAPADLVTAGGVLAVEAGETVEAHHADAYELGSFLGEHEVEDVRLRSARIKIADQYVAGLAESWKRLALRIEALPAHAGAAPALHVEWPEESRLAAFRAERIQRFRRAFARILSGLPVQPGEVMTLVTELVHLQRAHPERFAQLALLSVRRGDYLAEHCYAVAALSVAIAARLGWPGEYVRLAGLAGLLADVGMGLVPSELRASGRPLDEIEINRVRRHPTFSVLMLEAIEGLPEEVRRATYQHHERENGSGYPLGLRSGRISDLARVVAVADTFAATAARRRYRAAKRPYDAMEELIMMGSSGVYDRRMVRALVETAGLFPVGSHVLLSNNSPALVVGAKAEEIDRPIVRIVRRSSGGTGLGLTVHLTDFARNELWVSRPIDAPEENSK